MNDMKQFSLAAYLKNPKRKVVTRDGRSVRIICADRMDDDYPVVALVRDKVSEELLSYTEDGVLWKNHDDDNDLFFAPIKKEGWINIYECTGNANASRRIYHTKEEALACGNKGRIDTIKIEWEE